MIYLPATLILVILGLAIVVRQNHLIIRELKEANKEELKYVRIVFRSALCLKSSQC